MKLFISLPAQTLEVFSDTGELLHRYSVSTGKKGAGERSGSYMTPRGKHIIRAKIGAGCPENTVFIRRRPSGEYWTPELAIQHAERDWILARILWLSGREPGFNRLGDVDTMRRFIYIHGCPDTAELGTPGSMGCIRMRNRDIVELFDHVPVFSEVNIGEYRIDHGEGQPLSMADENRHTAQALHVLAQDTQGQTIGTARLLKDGQISHLSILPAWQGKGVGVALMRRLLEKAEQNTPLYLYAPEDTLGFYEQFGFIVREATSSNEGVPNFRMQKV